MAAITTLRGTASPSPFFSLPTAFTNLKWSCASSARYNSTSSNQWKLRRNRDVFVKCATRDGLKSRAAYKLIELHAKHKIFKRGQTVVDLGFAPGAWSQVAIDKVSPGGRVIGVDILPSQPPPGVSTFQGSIKSVGVRELLKKFLMDPERGKMRENRYLRKGDVYEEELEELERGYLDRERDVEREEKFEEVAGLGEDDADVGTKRPVDVVLSDMLMNTSGIPVRDHAYSIDLCYTAMSFAMDVLKRSGVFVCKVYQGDQEDELRAKLGLMFNCVYTDKPIASRPESREIYYVSKTLKKGVTKGDVFPWGSY
ncbi:23S ribosomal RNA methyltransferase [Tuber magnatum]|uniref:rRNA methyltransferase 2, mitochondrial n=1 Tax=Tuber magnatum TaxID=42249 RepID=A0A317SRY3_9PEZI|nr:23S ribosomal RNA methyltransferase [Tuber magnatum]